MVFSERAKEDLSDLLRHLAQSRADILLYPAESTENQPFLTI